MHHPHLVLTPIVIGIINNQLLDTAHPLDGQPELGHQLARVNYPMTASNRSPNGAPESHSSGCPAGNGIG
jgi:hypothetical protein